MIPLAGGKTRSPLKKGLKKAFFHFIHSFTIKLLRVYRRRLRKQDVVKYRLTQVKATVLGHAYLIAI